MIHLIELPHDTYTKLKEGKNTVTLKLNPLYELGDTLIVTKALEREQQHFIISDVETEGLYKGKCCLSLRVEINGMDDVLDNKRIED